MNSNTAAKMSTGRRHVGRGQHWSGIESLTSPDPRRRRQTAECCRTESSSGSDCGAVILSDLPECAIPLDCNQYADACSTRGPACCDGPHRYRHSGVRETYYDGFKVTITPLNCVTTPHSANGSFVEFTLRRKNKVVTMQWEPFTGCITQNGVSYLTVQQSYSNLPAYPVNIPYMLMYKGVNKMSYIQIDPHSTSHVKFYLNIEGTGEGVQIGDSISVPAGCVSWITVS